MSAVWDRSWAGETASSPAEAWVHEDESEVGHELTVPPGELWTPPDGEAGGGQLWVPGAERVVNPRSRGGTYVDGPWRFVFHTVEGRPSADGFRRLAARHRTPPHLWAMPTADLLLQTIPLDRSAYALARPGKVHTNRRQAVQVEVWGFARDMVSAPAEVLEWLARRVLAPVARLVPINLGNVRPAGNERCYGLRSPCRMAAEEWGRFDGVCGHKDVPDNAHWDPGGLDMAGIAERARALLAGGAEQREDEVAGREPPRTIFSWPVERSRWTDAADEAPGAEAWATPDGSESFGESLWATEAEDEVAWDGELHAGGTGWEAGGTWSGQPATDLESGEDGVAVLPELLAAETGTASVTSRLTGLADLGAGPAGMAEAVVGEAQSSPFRSPEQIEALAGYDDEAELDEDEGQEDQGPEEEGLEDGPRGDEANRRIPDVHQEEDEGFTAAVEGEHPLSQLFHVPAAVIEALAKGAFSAAIALAGAAGYRDVNDLTNIIFYFRHPHVIGRQIRVDEKDLHRAWLNIRDTIVRPALKAPAVPTPGPRTRPAPVGAKTSIPSSGLRWYGPGTATPELLAFMRDVYDRHVARSSGTFVDTLPREALESIEGGHCAQRAAALKAIELLAAARAANPDPRVKIGVTSAYRSADRQFEIWQGKGGGGTRGFPYYYQISRKARQKTGDEHGPEAAAILTALIAKYIAAPGYSNHQDGLAIDFGTGEVGKKGLAKIGPDSWFHKWLTKNAHRFDFVRYPAEAWHWVYKPPAGSPQAFEAEAWLAAASSAGIRAGRLCIDRSPVLDSHRGRPPDIVLRWNDMPSAPSQVDVVVHLHGYSGPSMTLPKDIERWSGLDLAPVDGATGAGRRRPTLTILPRGHFTGEQRGKLYKYTFPALITRGGLPKLIDSALDRFARHHGGSRPAVGRLILTAHSGGGAPLMRILRHHDLDPHEVHVFDGLYQDAMPLAEWALRHIQQDSSAGDPPGSALRVFYGPSTRRFSRQLLAAISGALAAAPSAVRDRYRVEGSALGHWQIARQYGWRVLADASANVPDTRREASAKDAGAQRLAERESLQNDGLAAYEWEPQTLADERADRYESEWEDELANRDETAEADWPDPELKRWDLEEASVAGEWSSGREDPELIAATAAYEALSAASETGDLTRHVPLREGEQAEDEVRRVGIEVSDLDRARRRSEVGDEKAFESDQVFQDEVFQDEVFQDEVFQDEVFAERAVADDPDEDEDEALAHEAYEDEEGYASDEEATAVELGEAEAFFDDQYTVEQQSGTAVTFPSGATLRVVVGSTGEGEEHHDPWATGNPVLDTSEPHRSTRLSANFTTGEFARSGGQHFDRARIDPALVRCLQKLRDHVAKPVTITSGYRPYAYNDKLYMQRYRKKPTKSRHSSGQAADVKIAGMTGMQVAKAAIDACGRDIGVGIADTFGHIDVRGSWARWTYFGNGTEKHRRAIAEIDGYRRQRLRGGTTSAPSTPAEGRPGPTLASGTPSAAQFTRATPERQRFAALVPVLDRYRRDIPLHFLLGWIAVESGGRIDVTTSLGERGFFQVHPAESKDHGLQHERLTTDPDYSVQAGIQLVRLYADLARKRFPWLPSGSELFWRIVKLQHAMGSGLTKLLLSDMMSGGGPPVSWEAIKAYEMSDAAKRLHRLLRVDPGRFGRNVDNVFIRGRHLASTLSR